MDLGISAMMAYKYHGINGTDTQRISWGAEFVDMD